MKTYLDKQLKHKHTRELFETVFNIARKSAYRQALEVGNAWAITTLAILMGGEGSLLSVDLNKYDIPVKQTKEFGNRIAFHTGEKSRDYLPKLVDRCDKFDLIVIDGGHDYINVKPDIENAVKLLRYSGVIIVDDYYHKKNDNMREQGTTEYGVRQAVDETIKEYDLEYKLHNKANGIIELWKK